MSFETVHIGPHVLYRGDCREVLPTLADITTCIVDPVWPNSAPELIGHENPFALWEQICGSFPASMKRLGVHMGCASDPRFLRCVPWRLPFFRVAWLEYVRMGYVGRLGMGSDVAYLYGEPPRSIPGQRIIPGRFIDASCDGKQSDHPCPRKLAHVEWLVKWWSEPGETVLDCCGGSGTTGVACAKLGRSVIIIEIERKYFDIACRRIEDAHTGGPLLKATVQETDLFTK